MERWEDQGIVLSVRPHGENGAVLRVLSEHHGLCAGYVRGAQSSKMRGTLEPGNGLALVWQSRTEGQLGSFSVELIDNPGAVLLGDALRLGALQSACALCDAALPEQEGHPGLFHGLRALLTALDGPVWLQAYVIWEIALLKELGFALDLGRCAGGGRRDDLAYVSPKTGRAVSAEKGQAYQDRLLVLPQFLGGPASADEAADIDCGLKLSGYFLEHWAFAHHTRGLPEARLRFMNRMAQTLGSSRESLIVASG
ncbi:MAG: DNA repair protein RecO [Alphaproteobacteria bacterium]|nr:DNA repair protein RecO [Alphaproteobacteria bacterium]